MLDQDKHNEVLWYVGSAYPETFDSYFATNYFKADANVSNLIYERRLFEASLALDPDAKMFGLPHVGIYPQQSKKAKVFYANNDPHYVDVPFNCFFLRKHVSQEKALRKTLLHKAAELPMESKIHIVICEAYLPYLKAVKALVDSRPNIRVTIIVPDLPEHVGSIGRGLKAALKKRYIRHSEELMRSLPADFILFSKAMLESPVFKDRKCLVSNGLCGPKVTSEKEPGLFVFAGKLNESNGVSLILQAMESLKGKVTCEIYGDGPLQKEVESAAKNNPSIVYGGYKEPGYVQKRMEAATGILATRLSSGQSPYQFPSKVLNSLPYMSPVICFDLPVFEEDLRKTLLIVNEDAQSLSDAIERVNNGKYILDEKDREEVLKTYSANELARQIKSL